VKALILAEGTRGDIQPCFALAEALDAAGHQPVVVGWARGGGFDDAETLACFTAVGQDDVPQSHQAAIAKITHGGIRGAWARVELARLMRPVMTATLNEIWAVAAQGADIVVHQPGVMAGQHIAEKLQVPAVAMAFTPIYVPTRETANPILPAGLPVPGILNRATYAATPLLFALYQGAISSWRRQALQLPPRRGQRNPLLSPDGRPAPLLAAYSQHAVPVPRDAPPHLHTTGYWLSAAPAGWKPPAELADFLRRGDPPVCIGFSGTSTPDPDQAWRTVLGAIQQARVRAVIATGWGGGFGASSRQDIHVTRGAPHAWLFPRVAAVVHHGGAGTTAAALAAGRAQVLCPFSFDQPFWGAQMRRLGVADTDLPLRKHTADTLGSAIRRAVSDPSLTGRAEAIGSLISGENGAKTAVRLLEEVHRSHAE
jgi:sterol 3beta-glucosyltransferase